MFKNTVNKNIGMIRCVTDENHFSLKVLGLTPLILGFPEINFSKLIFEIYRFIKSFYIPNLTNEYYPLTSSDMLSLFFLQFFGQITLFLKVKIFNARIFKNVLLN